MEKKIVKKLLALLMVATILMTDFFVLGSHLITYAAEFNSNTNNSNIQFSAYFKNGDKKVDSIEKSIKSTDLKLYAEVTVKSEGYFNGVIEIKDSNFNIKNDNLSPYISSIEGNKINLKQINAGETVKIELGIEPIISDKIKTDMLSKISKVELTGTYIFSENEGGANIIAEKEVSVNYKSDETAEAELKTQIITNKVFSVNETDKRIVQLLIRSRLTENQYPVQQTMLKIDVPELSGKEPEEVKVLALGELATNSATEISENDFKYENGILQITVKNQADENNQINWSKNVYDDFVATFIYDSTVDASKIEMTTNSEIKLHNTENTFKATETRTNENQELNKILMERTKITTTELYKGQLYANINATEKKDIQYNTVTEVIITNSNVIEQIIAKSGPDTFGTDESELAANTKYISTEINKEKMLKILGNDGNIEIKNGETTIVINKDSEVNENGNVVVNYANSATELSITTSKPVSEGILQINHTKAITANNYTREQLNTVKTLKAKNSVEGTKTVNKEIQNIVTNFTEARVELKETISKAELTVNREKLSTTEANELTLGMKLITDGEKYDLYKNPSIRIQLPAAVENVKLTTKASKLYADEFEISSKYDSTNKIIQIDLTGEQTTYPASAATQLYLQLNLNVTLSRLAATQTDAITMTYTNNNATQYDGGTTDMGIVKQPIQISAPTGLIKMYNLASNENTSLTENITQQVTKENGGKTFSFETTLVNNIGADIDNVRILGKLPTTGNTITNQTENTLETALKSIDAPNATVYYTDNVDATADIENTSNKWTTNLAEITNPKLYLIKVDSLSQASVYNANVNVTIPNTNARNETSYTEYQVIYDTDVQSDIKEDSRDIALTASIAEGLEMEFSAQVGQDVLKSGDTVREGEVIKYTTTLKNRGTQTLENLELKLLVPDGTVLVQPKEDYIYADGYYDEKDDKETTKTVSIESGKSYTIQYEVRVNTDITAGTEISNKAIVSYNGETMESVEIRNVVAEANVRVTVKRLTDEDVILFQGSRIKYKMYVENLSNEVIKDLDIDIRTDNFEVKRVGYEEEVTIEQASHIDVLLENEVLEISFEGEISEEADMMNVSVNVTDSNNMIYRSNTVTESFSNTDATITLTSPQNNANIKNGDTVEYNIIAKNTGEVAGLITINDNISECFEVQYIYMNGKLIEQSIDASETETYKEIMINDIEKSVNLNPGEEIKIDIIARVNYILEKDETRIITNNATVSFWNVQKDVSEVISHTFFEPEPVEDLRNTINGLVWNDENKNGQKDSSEKVLKDVSVKIYDTSIRNYLKDDTQNIIKTVTDESGKYEFSKIPNGLYIIVIEYDSTKYEPTTNSKAKLQELLIDGGINVVIGTEIIDIQDNISDINIALKEMAQTPETPEEPEIPEEPETPEIPEEPEIPENPENPEQPENPEVPGEEKDVKTITGVTWLDEDRDGEKDSGETVLSGIKVKIYDVSTKNYLKDENGNIIETTTDNNGEYIFNNIEKGSYIVLFEYDTEKYEPTTYMASGIDGTKNSKAIIKNININGEELTFAVTDTINVQDNLSNINLGLKEKLVFDLELNKYISKIVVQNSKETKTYEYENKSFAKAEIHRKQVNGSLVVLEYTIKVKNTGEISGYAKNIVDYLPSGLTFSSELNTDWYLSGNYLHTKGLENVEIAPGEEKEIKLILTKTMTNENTGLINNRAEIYEDYNKYGEVDIDSTPNNQNQNEDDFSSVDVIIGIKTGGSTIANIILLMVNLVLIGVAINLMIKNGIIKIPNNKKGRR